MHRPTTAARVVKHDTAEGPKWEPPAGYLYDKNWLSC